MCSPTLTRQAAARTTSLLQIASDISSHEKEEAAFHPCIWTGPWPLTQREIPGRGRIGGPTKKHANA